MCASRTYLFMRRVKKLKNRKGVYIIILIIGIVLFSIGGFLFKTDRTMAASFILIGIGSGLFGMSVGELIKQNIFKRNPEYKLKMEIETADERNIFIKNKAKAKAFDLMITVYGILMMVYALMSLDMTAVLLLVGAYLLVWGAYFAYFIKYYKEM